MANVKRDDSSLPVELGSERDVLVVQGGDHRCSGFELPAKSPAFLGLCRQAGPQVGGLAVVAQLLGGGSAACRDSLVPLLEDGLGSVDRGVAEACLRPRLALVSWPLV
jgi:hypothetical protein